MEFEKVTTTIIDMDEVVIEPSGYTRWHLDEVVLHGETENGQIGYWREWDWLQWQQNM